MLRQRLLWSAVCTTLFAALPVPMTAADAASPTANLASVRDDPLVREALAAEERFHSADALRLFLRAEAAHSNSPFLLQKISRQYSDLALDSPDSAARRRLCTTALAYAEKAVALDPRNAVNVLSVAICYGKLALDADTRTKVEYSRLVRRYAEQALALDPNYDYAHHVLGRWHYEVASLGATKRFLVRLVYGGLPNASTTEAIRHLRRAVELAPERVDHRVELGFALLADGQAVAARQVLADALARPPRDPYDTEAQRRARAALDDEP